jgi:hydroxymethylglutaryl-CoA reductase
MKSKGTSRLAGFYRKTLNERREQVTEETGVRLGEVLDKGLPGELAERMVENAVGVLGLPLGIATNFIVNGREVLVPMAIEEPSVIAAASNAARMARAGGGFTAEADPSLMAAQIEILSPAEGARAAIEEAAPSLLELADSTQPELVSLGGGARGLEIRAGVGEARLVVHLIVDCLDAMGANIVNTMAEALSGPIAAMSGGRAGLRILTNLADRRRVRVRCDIPFEAMKRGSYPGKAVSEGVVSACAFAAADPYRAATHNKGIFNGIDAVLIATGNDWRAVEAGGHAYASRNGRYAPLTTWSAEGETLVGAIELPMAVGIVGGASRAHPVARAGLELMGVETASDLAGITASVGLASNLAALAALAAEGIQLGHMRLHSRKNVSGS